MTSTITAPELMPVLSRGRHRNPRRGACFMEMASFLAGERWSDHPACTHPLLAELARLVNDSLTDRLRPRLMPLIPSVIGLTSDDVHVDAAIALRCAHAALPIAAAPRQNVLAISVIRCERVLAELDGRDGTSLSPRSRQVLEQVPEAAAWARSFSSRLRISPRTFRAQTAPHILSIAVEGIALASAPDVEQRLVDLLADTVADLQALILTTEAPEHLVAADLPAHSPGAALRPDGRPDTPAGSSPGSAPASSRPTRTVAADDAGHQHPAPHHAS
jgi:hypothetical protein